MVVRMRHTRAHTKNRRSHHGVKPVALSTCAECGAERLRHHACPQCGKYRGRAVTNAAAKSERKIVKRAEKAKALAGAAKKEPKKNSKKAEEETATE